jgi:hypothetical protein
MRIAESRKIPVGDFRSEASNGCARSTMNMGFVRIHEFPDFQIFSEKIASPDHCKV